MRGHGTAHGAATIVNAIATGKGGAFGIGLRTWADVEITTDGQFLARIEGFENEDTTLIKMCAREVINTYFPDEGFGARISTKSEIPISRGLKSSSAAANAVIMATLDALRIKCDSIDAIKIGTRCAKKAGVSITGAFDDACASYFGGIALTDNIAERIIKRDTLPDSLKVLIYVPNFQIRKNKLPMERIISIRSMVEIAFERAISGDYYSAMILNGLAYGAALGLDQDIAVRALCRGAKCSGISGTGPAIVALVDEEDLDEFLCGFDDVKFIVTNIYNGINTA
ncbi:MAG: shikimate kinase [Methanomassiliicoccales archaeon]